MGLFKDKTGILWVNTRLGLLKVRPQINPFDNYFNELSRSNTYYSFRGLTEDAKGIVYGVYYNGIVKFDPTRKLPLQVYTFKEILNFFDLSPEGDKIWVNSGQLFDPKTGKLNDVPSLFHKDPYSDSGFFTRDNSGTLWWASHYFCIVWISRPGLSGSENWNCRGKFKIILKLCTSEDEAGNCG